MAQGILIDPKAQTVAVVECDTNSLDAVTRLLGCDYFEVTRLPNDHFLLLDEEALVRNYRGQGYFHWVGAAQPFVGRGLVFGSSDGDLVTPVLTVAEVQAMSEQ